MYNLTDITIRRHNDTHYIDNLTFETFLGRSRNSYIKFNGRRTTLRRVTETNDDMDIGDKIRAINDGFYFIDNGVIHIILHEDMLI